MGRLIGRHIAVAMLAFSGLPAAQAALTINSVDTPTRIGRGQTVPVPVNYTRASGATPETITVDVPAELEIVPTLPPGCTVSGAAGTPQTLTCTGVNPGGVGASGTLSFNVRGRALGGGNVVASNAGPPASSATDSFTVVSGGDLSIAKTIAPGATLINGQTATFTLTPGLAGDAVPAGAVIIVTDQLPGTSAEFQLTSVNAPAPYVCNSVAAANASRTLSCTVTGPLASLSPITLQGRPTLTGAGGLINNASIAPDGINYIDTQPSNDTASLPFTVNPGADPRPEGSFPASAVTGTPQTLTIRFANDGPQTTNGGQVRTAIPAGFVIGTLPSGCVNSGAGTINGIAGTVITCTSGTVTSGSSQGFALPLTTPGSVQSGNFGVEVVTGTGGSLPGGLTDSNVGNNQVLVPFNIVPPFADLSITKSKTPGPLPLGAPITNTLSVTNNGIATASFSAGTGATPLRVVDTMPNAEEYVSASAGWTCTDGGANSGGAGLRRVVCVRDVAGTLAVGTSIGLTLNTRVAAALPGPTTLTNSACTGGAALTLLGLPPSAGPQPPDGNQNGGADCANGSTVGTPIVSGQAQASVLKESSRDGTTWVDAPGAAPTVSATDNSMFWRFTITTPTVAVNALQQPIPRLDVADALPGMLNLSSPGTGVPGYVTPAATVTTTLVGGAATGSCPVSVTAASPTLNCTFTSVAPGTTIRVTVQVDRNFEAGTFTNTAALSSPEAILTPAAGGQLQDDAALIVSGRTDPAITSKTVTPPNSATEPRVGQTITYTVLARNLGPNVLTGSMTVTDTLDPARFLITGATAVGSGASPPMSCSFVTATGVVTCATGPATSVSRYDFYTVAVTARILKPAVLPPAGIVSSFNNVATVSLAPGQNCEFRTSAPASAACNDANSRSNNTGSVLVDIKVPLIDVVQKKSRVLPAGQSNFGFGDVLRYRFRAQNNGPSRAETIQVTDRLNVPAGYTVVLTGVAAVNNVAAESGYTLDTSKTIATVNCSQAGANADVVCALAAGANNLLEAGAEVNFELTFTLTGAAQVISVGNTARICADETAGYESSGACVFTPAAAAGNNIASVNDVIFPKTDLAISKSRVTASPVGINQPVQYSLVAQNRGGDPTTQMRITDQLPPNFEWVTGTTFTPNALPGGFAGLAVSGLSCTATPAAITVVGQQQTVNCTLDGTFPGSTAVNNTVTVTIWARPKAGFYTGPYLSDRTNTATVAPGLDGGGQPLSIDTNPGNDTATALTQVQTASLAGTVFQDRDRSGANGGVPQAAGVEPRIAGVRITLSGTDASGAALLRTADTDSNGNYSFTDLPPAGAGGYTLTQTQPGGFDNGPVAPPAAGAGSPSVGGTYVRGGTAGDSSFTGITLALGATGVNYNFPELRRPSLSGLVYVDVNANNVRDAGTDLPIAGATVRLLNATTLAVISTATTDATGAYSFTNLDPLIPYVLEEPLPATPAGLANGPVNPGLVNGLTCAAGCTAQPNTPAAGTDRIAAIDLSAGTDGTVFNFGEVQQTSVSGLVWVDSNRNTTLDAAETTRLGGVTIRLVQGADCSAGTTVQTTTTAADGSYRFDNVRAFQNYLVCQTQPAGYGTGSAGGTAGSNVIAISNLSATGSSGNNFGETLASLAGSVYADTGAGVPANFNNGVRDAGEAGIVSVPVTLSGTDVLGNPVSITVNTDASGNYLFDGLIAAGAAGYTVTEGAIPPASGTFLDGRDSAGSVGGSTAVNDVISAVALAAGQQATGYLFGELPNTTISGTVYIDRDRDNLIDPMPTDGRIPGVTLRLVQGASCAAGTTLQTVTTDASGNYGFANVAAGGNYLICQTQPGGYANGAENPGPAGSSAAANVITITDLPASGSPNNHFGERVGLIAGSVFSDFSPATPANTDNGVRDAAETGIAGVPVTLSGRDINGNVVSLSTTTDASGNYSFGDLLQSDATGYTVTEGPIPPASGVFNDGRDRAGTPGGSVAVNDTTSAIVLGAGVQASGYTFGELPIAPITGTVYIDRDRDNLIDPTPTDGRIAGVTLTLVQGATCAGPVVANTTTDASGNYSFSGASAGLTYTICQTQPAAYADGGVNPGAGGASAAANAITITNLPATGSPGNHFGERVGSLAGSVYADFTPGTPANTNNGVRDAGEAGLAGVTLTLSGRDAAGNPVNLTTTTDASGNYRFDDLLAADAAGYTVSEGAIPPAAGTFNDGRETAGTAGGSTAVNDSISGINLGAGVQATAYLFGELPNTTISGTVYIDRDRDNTLDPAPTDGRIPGVTLRLVQGADCSTGTTVQTVSTDASGNYGFTGVTAGLNYLICQTQPAGYANGTENPGGSGSSTGANVIVITNLPAGGSSGNHFGERVASLAGAVYLDTNNDGTRQGSEAGIAGVTVTLTGLDAAGNAVSRTTTTDASGNYRFDDLLAAGAGGYAVTEQAAQPVVAGVTTLNGRTTAGSSGGTAAPVATTPSTIAAIALAAGADSTANNFGELLPVALGGVVFIDINDNGIQNPPGDTGLGGVSIVITGTDDTGAAVNRSLTTAADGSYAVTDLRPGTYTVTEPTQPAGTTNGQTVAGSAGGTATPSATTPSVISGIALLTGGASSTGNNFGEVPNTSVLSGRVWLDVNNNGLIDGTGTAAETGITGVTIELSGTDAAGRPVNRTTTTDATGAYSFANLAPGTYVVREPTQPAGTVNGTTVPGTRGGTATPATTTPSAISAITLGVGESSSANDFGEVPGAEIAGTVYADNNNNGTVDAGESGLPGVTLVLTGTDDQGNPVSVTTTTAADGSYSFPGLRPGTYTVTQPTQPPGTVNGSTTPGSAGGTATTPAVVPSAIASVVLTPGLSSRGNNFGELANSPDLRVSKNLVEPRLTVGFPGEYRISVRNTGELASSGVYTVSDRLPSGLTLAATPTGTGWTCVGAVAASTFTCTSSTAIAAGATGTNVITATVNVAAAAATGAALNNVVLVDGGGEIEARRPSAAERDAFNNNPAALPVCSATVDHNACRTPTPMQLAASVSGSVWYDIGSSPRLLDNGDRGLGGWQVEIVDPATGAIVGRATTGTDGSYRVPGLLPGVPLAVRFRDPASGIVFGYPVNGHTAPGSSGATCTPGATLGTVSSCIGSGASPFLTVVLAPGQDLPQQSLPVDPSGVVYDSGLRQPVPGSIVSLEPVGACAGWNPATGLVGADLGGYAVSGGRVSMTVGSEGFYQFLFAPAAPASCTWRIAVTPPPGYTFVSTAIPPAAGPLLPSGAAGSVFPVQPQASPPTAAPGAATTYYLTLTSGSAGANIIHNHIPLDPFPPTAISLSKTGDKAAAEVGDSVRYTITVAVSAGPRPRQTTVVDRLPAGFTYIRGTAMVGDLPIADPVGGLGPTLAFDLGPMPPSNQLVLRYRVRVGVGAMQGDGINRAKGHACGAPTGCVDSSFTPLAGSVATNEAAYRVRVDAGVFTTDACVLGKIFVDCNNNQVQDREELGVPGVRLVMQDGTTLISDSEGKYSICGVPAKSAVLKVDPITLPRGSRLITSSNRNLGDAASLWLDLKNGELHRADFIEGSCSNTVLEQVKARRAQGEVRAPETEKKGGPALRFDSKAHGKTPSSSPQQGTDGANQQAPKPRRPLSPPAGAADDETNVPATELPMNRPPPRGRDSGTAPDAGGANGPR